MPVVKFALQDKKRGFNARELLQKGLKIPDVATARYVSIFSHRRLIDKDRRLTCELITITRNPNEKARKHKMRVSARQPGYSGAISEAPKIIVQCDCLRYLYKWEYALWNAGCAKLIYGNGEPPVMTNPRLLVRVCKHLIVSLAYMIKNKI